MFYEESLWLKRVLEKLELPQSGLVLDIGSSDEQFRKQIQPYIHENVHAPLLRRGVRLLHSDAKAAAGVDVVMDVTADSDAALDAHRGQAELVLCTNMLEHVSDRVAVARRLCSLLSERGILIVTVPGRYPEHLDPIDTLFRPSPQQIEALFRPLSLDLRVLERASVAVHHPRHYRPKSRWRRYVPFAGWRLSGVVFQRGS
jgi:SAM-dependent methyltransferase